MTRARDMAAKVLSGALRFLPQERREWGLAMLAELEQIRDPFERWRFALGCVRVALLPPRKGTLEEDSTMSRVRTLVLAAYTSTVLILPFAILEVRNNAITGSNLPSLIVLFGHLWILALAFFAILVPTARAIHFRSTVRPHPAGLLLRAACLTLLAVLWGSLVLDQLPCFLGHPNCD